MPKRKSLLFITVSEEDSIERIFYQLLVYFRAILSSDASFVCRSLNMEVTSMPYAHNEGVRIHYQTEGAGPPLILQHGFTDSLESWYELRYVEALQNAYRLILVDARGHGASPDYSSITFSKVLMPKNGETYRSRGAKSMFSSFDSLNVTRFLASIPEQAACKRICRGTGAPLERLSSIRSLQ